MVVVWREDGIVENIEANQSYYKGEVGKVGRKDFDRNLKKIPSCYAAKEVYTSQKYSIYSLNLHPDNGFIWDKEQAGSHPVEEEGFPLQGGRWSMKMIAESRSLARI